MENAIAAALSRQVTLARALDVTANNVANQSTPGFKAERAAFREFLAPTDPRATAPASPLQDPFVSLVIDPASYTDFAAGGLEATGGDLDFAINGDGFFAVETASGVRYTRDGRFTVNNFGELTTLGGAPVLGDNGAAILVDVNAGPIVASPEGDLQQNGVTLGRLGVFLFDDRQSLRKTGGNLFEAAETPKAADTPRLARGFIETSNVASIDAMTDMVEILRAYQQATEVISSANELSREAVRRLSDVA